MASVSGKNFAISSAGVDLGLGDQVQQQLQDQEEERKKKLLQMSKMPAYGPATMSLLGQQLIGPAGG
jgi:hypothetical protein